MSDPLLFPAPPEPLVVQGKLAPLADVPFHAQGPLTRWLMAGSELDPRCTHIVAIHQFDDVPAAERRYCTMHTHPYDEINVIHSTSALTVELRLGDAVHLVEAPATVFIPAGVPHAANVVQGSGFLVAILADGHYRAAGV